MGTDIHFDPNVRFEFGDNISIGKHFWIGGGVQINQGVTTGDNTIIGSRSVVTKDIPNNVIAAGVPCKVIRSVTNQDKTGYQSY